MAEQFSVRFIRFLDGERYPLLLDPRGQPHWYATLFATTQIRNASKTPNTIAAVLAAIRILLSWSHVRGQDLEHRFTQKDFLTEHELESIRCYTQIKAEQHENNLIKLSRNTEKTRGVFSSTEHRISSSTQYIRLTYIADYLEWLAIRLVERDARHVDTATLKTIKRMSDSLRARRPQKMMKSREQARKGLTEEQQEALLKVVQPGSANNPFSEELQVRNQLIVWLLYHLGLRAGELLSLRVSDFDFMKNTLLVARRHDNPNDVRTYQPVVKTFDRRIPLSEGLIKAVSNYILGTRRLFFAAKRHDYLLVVHRRGPFAGQPISLKGLDKVFQELQAANPDLLRHLTPHVLRHTANDRLSALMDKNKVSPAEEEKMRSYLMGWKEGSGTASTYTRRHIERKAQEVALLLQKPFQGDSHV
jgi:integrase